MIIWLGAFVRTCVRACEPASVIILCTQKRHLISVCTNSFSSVKPKYKHSTDMILWRMIKCDLTIFTFINAINPFYFIYVEEKYQNTKCTRIFTHWIFSIHNKMKTKRERYEWNDFIIYLIISILDDDDYHTLCFMVLIAIYCLFSLVIVFSIISIMKSNQPIFFGLFFCLKKRKRS